MTQIGIALIALALGVAAGAVIAASRTRQERGASIADPSLAVTFPLIDPVCWPNAVAAMNINTRLRHSLRSGIKLPPLFSL